MVLENHKDHILKLFTIQGFPTLLYLQYISTPIGHMVAISSNTSLYLLEFIDRKGLELEINNLVQSIRLSIKYGTSKPIDSIAFELSQYFNGQLKQFKTPISFIGSSFQKRVWLELQKIPLGSTCSYSKLADAIGNPKSCRAVARANSTNQLAIIVPCHRIINKNGSLGGYSSGISRKAWLINHESNYLI